MRCLDMVAFAPPREARIIGMRWRWIDARRARPHRPALATLGRSPAFWLDRERVGCPR
jgi:hypothetical protein